MGDKPVKTASGLAGSAPSVPRLSSSLLVGLSSYGTHVDAETMQSYVSSIELQSPLLLTGL